MDELTAQVNYILELVDEGYELIKTKIDNKISYLITDEDNSPLAELTVYDNSIREEDLPGWF
jgi:hypothetical protein